MVRNFQWYFFPKQLLIKKNKYRASKLEGLAIVEEIKLYPYGREFQQCTTDPHALKVLLSSTRMSLCMSMNTQADAFSRQA